MGPISLRRFALMATTLSALIVSPLNGQSIGSLEKVAIPTEIKQAGPTRAMRHVRKSLRELLAAKQAGTDLSQLISSSDRERGDPMDGTPELLGEKYKPGESLSLSALQASIPTWTDSFFYKGIKYTYRMIGTDPKLGSKTTVIPTVIIPMRFVFPDGSVFDSSTDIVDGQTAVQGITNSPIFQNYNFVIGGKSIGNTQYGDAFQRANFWDSVSGKSKNYHVLLGQPTVLPTQTITVPPGLGSYEIDPVTGALLPLIDRDFLIGQTAPILNSLNIQATTLPILVWGSVTTMTGGFGWHGWLNNSSGDLQTYIGTSYGSQASLGGYYNDVYSLSHEIIEWMDDPFGNYVPGWNYAFVSDDLQCDSRFAADLLETADPVEILTEANVSLPGTTFTYHVTEGMFIDFYTRASHSRSINGQYSFFEIGRQYGVQSAASTPCTGHLELTDTQIFGFSSTRTEIFGINNNEDIVGIYADNGGRIHGFLSTPTSGQLVDFPGAIETRPSKINDSGFVVGYYFDASGLPHGFSYSNGNFTTIDYPGAYDTLAFGINRNGDIVGLYDGMDFKTYGFVYKQGRFTSFTIPFKNLTALTSINAAGSIIGFDSLFFFPEVDQGFLISGKRTSAVPFPGSNTQEPWGINNQNTVTGLFTNADGYSDGFLNLNGTSYEIYARTFDVNDNGTVVGSYDLDGVRYAFYGRIPQN